MASVLEKRFGLDIHLLDSVAEGGAAEKGALVVTGSHGGISAARYALTFYPRLVVFNDAGIGKDEAGIAGLWILEAAGVAAAAVAHTSARIGEARDALENGVISRINAPARALGMVPGELLLKALERLANRFRSLQ